MKRLRILAASLLLLTACPSLPGAPPPEPTSVVVDGDYVHPQSGFVFPERFERFKRVAVTRFDSEGNDVGVGYEVDDGSVAIALTIYVRPPLRTAAAERLTLPEQFEVEQSAILQNHPGALTVSTLLPPATRNREPGEGRFASFHYEQSFAGERQPVESLLYLYETEGQVVKYRITYPAAQAEAAEPVAEAFVRNFRWKGGP